MICYHDVPSAESQMWIALMRPAHLSFDVMRHLGISWGGPLRWQLRAKCDVFGFWSYQYDRLGRALLGARMATVFQDVSSVASRLLS